MLMDESTEKIYARHKGLIRSLVNSIVVNNPAVVSADDLQQSGALALIVALKSYNPSVGSFSSYVRSCIRNALLEQANSFNETSTVDEKARRQANIIVKLRASGVSDEEIMTSLGIKTRATFLSLVDLTSEKTIDMNNVEIPDRISLDEKDIFRMLDEIGLSDVENRFINLVVNNYSMSEIEVEMNLSRSHLYNIKASIKDKILELGRE